MEKERLENIRHSLAHLLAAAVLKLYPEVKNTLGPAIENGFYYDFDFGKTEIGDKDLPKIEKKMRQILKTWKSFEAIPVTAKEARKIYSKNQYKLELIDEIESKKESITLYYSGPKDKIPTKEDILDTEYRIPDTGFVDLCRGGHVEDIKEIDPKAFKLSHIAGAYWRGDETRTMLTRIYGMAFETKEELDGYIIQQEEAKKRDHRKLGRELDLFTFSDLVGSGLPLFTPKGTIIRKELQNSLLEISKKYGMQPVTIPHIAKKKLYETSGHAQKFGKELLRVTGHYDEFVMKPVNCPHHTQIYASRPRSYRDLPLRYMESTMMYRDEKPGEIGGLTRVRSITVDDGHIFCTADQIKDEVKNIAHIIEEFYTGLGMYEERWISLSVRDPKTPDAYIGDPKDWDKAEAMLDEMARELKLDAKRVEGEAAIYGPKIDYVFKDSLGRDWQLATIQLDFVMPKRFGLTYTDNDGKEKTPVMIHRAILGSYERFMAILIEHFAGSFPVWLSPVQVVILPISEEKHGKYGREIYDNLKEAGFRVELMGESESLSKRILQAKTQKVPYLVVIGDKEIKSGTITVEGRGDERHPDITIEEFKKLLKENVENKKE